jgi:hypothetical protein
MGFLERRSLQIGGLELCNIDGRTYPVSFSLASNSTRLVLGSRTFLGIAGSLDIAAGKHSSRSETAVAYGGTFAGSGRNGSHRFKGNVPDTPYSSPGQYLVI